MLFVPPAARHRNVPCFLTISAKVAQTGEFRKTVPRPRAAEKIAGNRRLRRGVVLSVVQNDHQIIAEPRRFRRYSPILSKRLRLAGGAGGIRTLDTLLTYTHFPGERLRPLGHRSACTGTGALIAWQGFRKPIGRGRRGA